MRFRARVLTLLIALASCAGPSLRLIAAQSITIQAQPDTALRLFATYRTASGGASSSTNVTVVSRSGICKVTPVPGTSRGRYVYVLGTDAGPCWIVASATVSAKTYRDSLYVSSTQQTRYIVTVATPPSVPPPPPPAPPPAPPPPPPALRAVIVDPPSCSGLTCILDGSQSTGPIGKRFEWFEVCSACNPAVAQSRDSIWVYTAPSTTTRTRGLRVIAPDGAVSTATVTFAAPGTGTPVPPPPPPGPVPPPPPPAPSPPPGAPPLPPQAPQLFVDIRYPAVTGTTINVPAPPVGSLQNALNAAACGDEIVLAAGASYTGNHVLPAKGCTAYIVIRSAGPCPAVGTRVTPATASGFAKILAPGGNLSPIEAINGAGYYRLSCLEVTAPSSVASLNSLVRLSHTGATTIAQLPHHIILDRVYVHGHATMALTRCVMLNVAWGAVIDSHLDDCHTSGSDSQAIASYNGTGPFLIENNYLAGAGENVMFGGSDPTIPGLIPSDIVFRRNHVTTPASWQGRWTKKNLLELKNAQRVLIEGNVFENHWIDGQSGHAFNFKSTNQSGTAPWSVTRDVDFRYNLVWKAPCGMKVSSGEHVAGTAGQTERIRIVHNMFADIGVTYVGCASIFQLQYDLADLTVENNTGWAGNSAVVFYGLPAMTRVSISGNILGRGAFGFKGDGTGEGIRSIDTYMPGGLVTGNLILGGVASSYPAGNSFPASVAAAGLVSADGKLWGLAPSSAFLTAGPGGTRPGVDLVRLQQMIAGVAP